MRTLLPALLLLAGCASTVDEPAVPEFLGNPACPKSGRPIDPASSFEHEGQRVWFCNPDCAAEGARDPEAWIARAYPAPVDVGNVTCPVSSEPVSSEPVSSEPAPGEPGAGGPVLTWQGHRVTLCCSTCAEAFRYDPEGYVREALAASRPRSRKNGVDADGEGAFFVELGPDRR